MQELFRMQCNCTDDMVSVIRGVLKAFGKNNIREVRLRVDEKDFFDSQRPVENWPLRITIGAESVIYITGGINIGYKGQGPMGTIKAIQMMGFNLSPEDISKLLSEKNVYMRLQKKTN